MNRENDNPLDDELRDDELPREEALPPQEDFDDVPDEDFDEEDDFDDDDDDEEDDDFDEDEEDEEDDDDEEDDFEVEEEPSSDKSETSELSEPSDAEIEDDLSQDGVEDEAPLKPVADEEPEKEGIENETPDSSFHARDFRLIREPRGKLFATNWLDDVSSVHDCELVKVQFKNTRSGFYRNVDKLDLKIGDMVAVEASPGHDIGEVVMVGPLVQLQLRRAALKRDSDIKRLFRIARPADLEKYEEAKSHEVDTMIRSRQIAAGLGLNMKIGDVEYQGDGGKAIFYYIADERVDFRKLIRLLADAFKVRIEMKQIGARQEAGRIGGIGPCGRPLCCASWMTRFVSVGTSLARMQDLSMNPQKLAGQCAKLKCCLNFEAAAYSESQKKLPAKDIVLYTKDADYYLFKSDVLQRLVTYSTEKGSPTNAVTITARRAHEIIALNKQGIKVDSLEEPGSNSEAPAENRYFDLAEQDSLTRFDRSKKRRRGKKGDTRKRQEETSADAPKAQKPAEPKENKERKQRQPAGEGERKPRRDKERRRNGGGGNGGNNPGEQPQQQNKQRPPKGDRQPRQEQQPRRRQPKQRRNDNKPSDS